MLPAPHTQLEKGAASPNASPQDPGVHIPDHVSCWLLVLASSVSKSDPTELGAAAHLLLWDEVKSCPPRGEAGTLQEEAQLIRSLKSWTPPGSAHGWEQSFTRLTSVSSPWK